MKIVIDIPEDLYEVVKENGIPSYKEERNVLADAIADGIPLPKGHGDLKDVGKFVYDCDYEDEDGIRGSCDKICFCDNCNYHIIKERDVKDAPTIIEADKGKKND